MTEIGQPMPMAEDGHRTIEHCPLIIAHWSLPIDIGSFRIFPFDSPSFI